MRCGLPVTYYCRAFLTNYINSCSLLSAKFSSFGCGIWYPINEKNCKRLCNGSRVLISLDRQKRNMFFFSFFWFDVCILFCVECASVSCCFCCTQAIVRFHVSDGSCLENSWNSLFFLPKLRLRLLWVKIRNDLRLSLEWCHFGLITWEN